MTKTQIIEQLKKFPSDESKAVWLLSQVEKLDEDYHEFKDKLEDKMQALVNDVFEQDIGLEKDIKRWAAIGQRYESWIERFKMRIAVDDCVISNEAADLLKMAKHEILDLRKKINRQKRENSIIKKDIKEMERQIYAHEKIQSLETNAQKRKAKKLCEGVTAKFKIDEIIEGLQNG